MTISYKTDGKMISGRMTEANQSARTLAKIPWIKMVALTGSMARGKANIDSDIDFFIQTIPGRVYLTRFLTTAYIWFLGRKRTKTKIAGRLCLNWYADYNAPQKQKRKYSILAKQSACQSNRLWNIIELIVKYLQINRFRTDPRSHISGSQVRWSDHEIGLHPPKNVE